MINKITHTKLFFPAVSAMLFVCTCFFCSCYTTDIIKPEPEKIEQESTDEIETIALKNGKKISGDNKQIELNYDAQLRSLALSYNISADTIKISEGMSKLSYKSKSISLDSIQYIKYHKLNVGLSMLAVTGVVLGVILVTAIIVAIATWKGKWLSDSSPLNSN